MRISRFALSRLLGEDLVLESPLSLERVTLQDPLACAVVTRLARSHRIDDLCDSVPDLERPVAAGLVGHLLGTGMVLAGTQDPGSPPSFDEDGDRTLLQWDFHDLLFHARSRRGRHDYSYGASFRFLGSIDPLPAVKAPGPGAGIDLKRPTLETLVEGDPTLTETLEARISVREYGADPIHLRQLGEFLYRVARVRATYGPLPDAGMPYEASDRPFPTGGSGHDLELYLTINRCGGLERGIYHYDPLGHRLHLLHNREEDIGAMLRESRVSTGGLGPPDVLITVTSRFQRLGWKYDSIAYATTLRNVGVLYQTMYLVATAMGLAPCALGGGDCEVAGRALGLELTKESSVGDFMLGSLPDPERFAGERARWSSQADLWRPANDAEWMRIRERVIRRRES
jgi:SagB-type dehydrogenase family enzyme